MIHFTTSRDTSRESVSKNPINYQGNLYDFQDSSIDKQIAIALARKYHKDMVINEQLINGKINYAVFALREKKMAEGGNLANRNLKYKLSPLIQLWDSFNSMSGLNLKFHDFNTGNYNVDIWKSQPLTEADFNKLIEKQYPVSNAFNPKSKDEVTIHCYYKPLQKAQFYIVADLIRQFIMEITLPDKKCEGGEFAGGGGVEQQTTNDEQQTKQQVAKEIYNQLGKGTMAMLGAHDIFFDSNTKYGTLEFKIRGSKKCKHIKIELNGMDTYDVTFSNWHKIEKPDDIKREVINNVYNDMLHEVIEEHTGLLTKLAIGGNIEDIPIHKGHWYILNRLKQQPIVAKLTGESGNNYIFKYHSGEEIEWDKDEFHRQLQKSTAHDFVELLKQQKQLGFSNLYSFIEINSKFISNEVMARVIKETIMVSRADYENFQDYVDAIFANL